MIRRPAMRRLLWWMGVGLLALLQLTALTASTIAATINLGQYFPAHLPKPSAPPPAVGTRVEQLRLDIAYLARELPRVYAAGTGFHHGSVEEFRASAARLEQELPALDPAHVLVGIMRLIAMLHDGETGLFLPPDPQLPMVTSWLNGQLRLIAVPASQPDLLGAQVLAINNISTAEVRHRLRAVIPAVTDWEADALSGTYLRQGMVLEGLDITDRVDEATLTVSDLDGQVRRVTLTAEPANAGPRGGLRSVPTTLATEHPDRPYWWRYLADSNVVYVRYNQCLSGSGFGVIAREAAAAMRTRSGSRLVVDLRGNGGGNSAPFGALLRAIHNSPSLDQPGRIVGLIGRGTFSSATLNAVELRTETHAVLIGEPTGDPANQWGNQRNLVLTDYLPVHYSTHYFDPAARYHGKPYVSPDLVIPTTLADLLQGKDPVLSAALQHR